MKLRYAWWVLAALGGCIDGPVGAFGPGGKANAFQVEGVVFDEVRTAARAGSEGDVRLRAEGEVPSRGGCPTQVLAFEIGLDPRRLDEGPLPVDLDIAHVVLDGEPPLDAPDRDQPMAIRRPRWTEGCEDGAPVGFARQSFEGRLRLSFIDDRRLEAFGEVAVTTTSTQGPETSVDLEVFWDLRRPATSTSATP